MLLAYRRSSAERREYKLMAHISGLDGAADAQLKTTDESNPPDRETLMDLCCEHQQSITDWVADLSSPAAVIESGTGSCGLCDPGLQ